jgi:hypothetical protein
MSTANTMPNSQTPPQLPEVGEPKFTATQIDKDCPAHLQRIEAAAYTATPLQDGISATPEMLGQDIVARIEAGDKSADEAAAELKICGRTLDRWRRLGEGPPITKLRRRVLYWRSSLHAWLQTREHRGDAA